MTRTTELRPGGSLAAGPRRAAAGLAVLLALVLAGCTAPAPRLLLNGITADRLNPGALRPLPVPPAGQSGRLDPAGRTLSPADLSPAQRHWLTAGTVPGQPGWQRAMARTALADLRLLTRPDGAVAAAWYGAWKYDWPRDSAWVAAALAVTGHPATARQILGFLARAQSPSGRFAARYQLSGRPVWTGLAPELDDQGWFPWAVWVWHTEAARAGAGRAQLSRQLAGLWPAVARSAGYAAAALRADGLPPASPDYWENQVTQPTIETAAALLAGLRAAGRLAGPAGDPAAGRRLSAAAGRLARTVSAAFGPQYGRFPHGYGASAGDQAALSVLNGPDAAVTFLNPPFARPDPAVAAATGRAARALTLPDGGVLPGSTWSGSQGTAWTPATGFFALADAAAGNRAGARRWLAWLAAHRTTAGELPEQVSAAGQPVSVAPLAWTDAIVLLTLAELDRPLPVP
jgi:GH15 family glucan-1,4-alpha-glucosidase